MVASTKEQAFAELLQTLLPSFEDKTIAIGDSCLAAIHYGGPFEGMHDFSFAMLRDDYDRLVANVEQTAIDASLIFDGTVKYEGTSYPKPFVRIGKEFADAQCTSCAQDPEPTIAWLNLYPLEPVPRQIILRLRLFKQASRLMRRWASMEESGVYSHMASFMRNQKRIRRFAASKTGLYSNLYEYPNLKHTPNDERTDERIGNNKHEANKSRAGKRTVFQRTISQENLFPVRMMDFAGTKIPVARKVSNWALEMTPTRTRAISIIQSKDVEGVQEIGRVSKDLGITYFLVGGCLLGAVRHEGFIPWDDDVDVGMVRKDYKKFCRSAQSLLKDNFALQLPSTDKHSYFLYARLRDKSTKYVTAYNENNLIEKGIWCDIFPFDAKPKSKVLARTQHFLARNFARASMGFKRRKEYIHADVQLDTENLARGDRIYLRLYRIGAWFFPAAVCRGAYNFFARMFNPFLSNRENAQYVCFVPTYTTITRQELFPCRLVQFEGESLNAPQQAEAFLARQYGNYTNMPPLHERCSGHGLKYLVTEDGEIIEP